MLSHRVLNPTGLARSVTRQLLTGPLPRRLRYRVGCRRSSGVRAGVQARELKGLKINLGGQSLLGTGMPGTILNVFSGQTGRWVKYKPYRFRMSFKPGLCHSASGLTSCGHLKLPESQIPRL